MKIQYHITKVRVIIHANSLLGCSKECLQKKYLSYTNNIINYFFAAFKMFNMIFLRNFHWNANFTETFTSMASILFFINSIIYVFLFIAMTFCQMQFTDLIIHLIFLLISAPRSRSCFTISIIPFFVALIKAVSPCCIAI